MMICILEFISKYHNNIIFNKNRIEVLNSHQFEIHYLINILCRIKHRRQRKQFDFIFYLETEIVVNRDSYFFIV